MSTSSTYPPPPSNKTTTPTQQQRDGPSYTQMDISTYKRTVTMVSIDLVS